MNRRTFRRTTMKSLAFWILTSLVLSGCMSRGSSPQDAPVDSDTDKAIETSVPVDSDIADKSIETSILDKMTSDVEITFIGNCGFLIVSGDTKILVDAPCTWYLISDETMELMENGEPPFDEVDLVLITHAHGDHFNAEAVGKHLENNPHAVFVSTYQTITELKRASPNLEGMQERLIGVEPEVGERILLTANGIDVEVFNLPHGENPISNNGYLFTVGGVKMFHTGDFTGEYFKAIAYQLPGEGIDIAFVPYFSLHGAWDYIQAKYVVPMHFDNPGPDNKDMKAVGYFFTNVIWFFEEMQKINIREFLEEAKTDGG